MVQPAVVQFGGQMDTGLVTELSSYINSNWDVLLNIFGGLVGVLAGLLLSRLGQSRRRDDLRVRQIGRLTQQIKEKERIIQSPGLHATIVDRQNMIFSFFTLVSAVFVYVREMDWVQRYAFNGLGVEDWLTSMSIATGLIALLVLASKWTWSQPFLNLEEWTLKRQAKIDRLQKDSLGERKSLDPSNAQTEALLKSADTLQEARPEATGDRFSTFLRSRKPMRFKLSAAVDDGQGDRPWEFGTVKRVGTGRYGFIEGRTVDQVPGNRSLPGDEYYFSYANVCNTAPPEEGDEAFFITSARSDAKESTGVGALKAKRAAAHIVCLRDKTVRGLVRSILSNTALFVEIVDGAENYASVLGKLEHNADLSSAKLLSVGDAVEGIVTHNNLGMMLKDVRPV